MFERAIKKDYSVIFLILANLIPIAGILFFGWSIFSVLIFYWLESLVIGAFNVVKMAIASKQAKGIKELEKFEKPFRLIRKLGKIFLILAFIFHYGIFMFVHLMFIFAITGVGFDFSSLYGMIKMVALPVLSLFLSHGVSFFVNFIGKKEYKKVSEKDVMLSPYRRIIVMHLTIILGAFLSVATGFGNSILVLFIALKIFVDLRAHKKEHEIFN